MTRRLTWSWNDAILLFSFLYSGIDISREWNEFSNCSRPIQFWLLVSYATMVAFRLSHYAGQYCSEEGEDFLLYFRQRALAPRLVLYFTWVVLLPFFVCWTVMGTCWLMEIWQTSPNCLPAGTHPWFVIFWQVLCYLWIAIYCVFIVIAIVLEKRVSEAEANYRSIETPDVLRRWGRMSFFGEGMAVALNKPNEGMTPMQIQALPTVNIEDESQIVLCGDHCSICLTDFKLGDKNRRLPSCRHVFHQSCIDIWLLRRADCPLCKELVVVKQVKTGYNSMDIASTVTVPNV